MPPDPKPVRTRQRARGNRVVDRPAVRAAHWRGSECAGCGRAGVQAHHVVAKGSPHFGDDVDANLILLCHGCHAAVHGTPFVDGKGRRWEPADVRALVGVYLARERPDIVRYVTGKMGEIAGLDWLRRKYGLRQ